jgi:hypothetical protein
MKKFLLIAIAFLITGCGAAVQKSTTGYVEETRLLIRADKLVGLNVSIGDIVNKDVEKTDLEKYRLGVWGAKNTERENQQTAIFIVEKGEHQVLVTDGDTVVYDAVLFFSNEQTREIRIKQ